MSVSHSHLYHGPLGRDLVHFLRQSTAPSTQNTYRSGIRSYTTFCLSNQITPFPVTEASLCFYAVSLANRKLSFKTIKVYIFGVLYQNNMLGQFSRLSDFNILFHTLRGIRRSQGNLSSRPPRSPITIQHLHIILDYLNHSGFSPTDKAMFQAASLLAFFGLLRVSEYTCPSPCRFDPTSHLQVSNVSFNANFTMMLVRIKASKTDPFRQGTTIRLSSLSHRLCPVAAMRIYLQQNLPQTGPLFVRSNGQFFTRRQLVTLLNLALPNVPNINTHSFRIGGASAALSSGASDSMIRSLGRWTSDCYLRYLRISDNDIHHFQSRIASLTLTSTIWDPDKW